MLSGRFHRSPLRAPRLRSFRRTRRRSRPGDFSVSGAFDWQCAIRGRSTLREVSASGRSVEAVFYKLFVYRPANLWFDTAGAKGLAGHGLRSSPLCFSIIEVRDRDVKRWRADVRASFRRLAPSPINAEAFCRRYLGSVGSEGAIRSIGDAPAAAVRSLYVRLQGPESGKRHCGEIDQRGDRPARRSPRPIAATPRCA
jgi:hypothetical protein